MTRFELVSFKASRILGRLVAWGARRLRWRRTIAGGEWEPS
jgi:hypothetical protein